MDWHELAQIITDATWYDSGVWVVDLDSLVTACQVLITETARDAFKEHFRHPPRYANQPWGVK